MSYLEEYEELFQYDFTVINQNKNMIYKDYKLIKQEINLITPI
jgi:hypothetical protein